MQNKPSTAVAHPNIAFIKYWGNKDHDLRIPVNNSISMNLEGLQTKTTVAFREDLMANQLTLNGEKVEGEGLDRVSHLIERIKSIAKIDHFALIESENNFPTGSGIASSAAGFAALALSASHAAGLSLSENTLSALARSGSGSASRSIPTGFVEWEAGTDHDSSYASSIAPPEHWEIFDCIAVISSEHKSVGSTGGHQLADTSPLQNSRVKDAPRRLDICRDAISQKDFEKFSEIVEMDSNLMHAVMMTSAPNLFYWKPETLEIINAVHEMRNNGLEVCYTIDAGPNVHVICTKESKEKVKSYLSNIKGVKTIIESKPGGPAKLI